MMRAKLRLILVGVVLAAVASAVALWPRGARQPSLAERWGIDNLRVHTTAAGNLLDFRYRVADAAKAAAVQDRQARPYLLDLKSGRKLAVPTTPKAGALWNHGSVKAGRTYFALFSNPGRLVRRGDRVSVVIDKLVAENLVVE